MRSTRLAPAMLLTALAGACATAGGAYGPSSDQRLEEATAARPSTEGAEVSSVRCSDLPPRLKDAKNDDKPEAERLTTETELYTAAKDRFTKLDEAAMRNPDLLYAADGEAIKAAREECQSFYADARSELDRTVREICEMPVIQEVQGAKTVGVARMDFKLVRNAVEALSPDDKDALLGKLDAAERRVAPKAAPSDAKGAPKKAGAK
jgi:uncharacterized protein YcaQ